MIRSGARAWHSFKQLPALPDTAHVLFGSRSWPGVVPLPMHRNTMSLGALVTPTKVYTATSHKLVCHALVTLSTRRQLAAAPQALPDLLQDSTHEGFRDVSDVPEDLLQVEAAAVADESLKITNCNLSRSTVQALEKKGIDTLFPIQKSVFDPAMAGTDLVARARTGSGKTLAFSLPIIEALLKQNAEDSAGRGGRAPRAIILAPTRELAKQVASEFESATNGRDLNVLAVYGGTPIGAQIRQIESGVDVLVGTPGRVIDLVDKRQVLQLSAVQFFILDEADEMLNMGFQDDVEAVLASVPDSRQTMMFSATMPQWVRRLARKFCRDHIIVDLVGEHDTGRVNSDVKCLACTVPPDLHAKRLLLVDLITIHSRAGKTIVFCNTKRECETVVTAVSAIMPAEALHGNIQQDMREYTMGRFREGKTHVLVATDVAARGLDVNNVDLVVHWDVPQDSETYLHRSGRTGRAGNKGTAIMMIAQRDKGRVAEIIRGTKVDLDLIRPPTPQAVLESVAGNIEQSLVSASSDVAKYFESTARKLLDNGVGDAKEPAEVLAVVMAQISGYTQLPKERSMLGQSEGCVTLGICTPRGRGFPSPGALVGSIRRISDESTAGAIGKIELFDDVEEAGFEAAFDIPVSMAANVIAAAKEHGARIEELISLPLDIRKLMSYR
eukprot:jgi/Ulvmu1/7245/UM035_0032.1